MKKVWLLSGMLLMSVASVVATSQYVKTKQKKESASQIKDDIVELLVSVLRQLGQNIQQTVDVQNQAFDMIRKIFSDNQLSAEQLRDLRCKLEKHLKKLEAQQAELYDILLSCK